MNRKVEIIIGILIVLTFVFILGKNILSFSFDSYDSINKLKEAVINEDIKYLKNHLEIENYESSLNNNDIKNIVAFLRNQYIIEDDWNEYLNTSNRNFYIKKSGKEKLLFDKFILVLKPYELILSSDTPGAIVYIDGKEVGKIDKKNYEFKYNPILPGQHKIKLKYEGKYAKLEKERELGFFNETEREIHYNIELEPNYINIYCNYPEAKLFVNNKDTGKTIEEIDVFGPVTLDGSIYLQAILETKGKTFKSDKVPVDDYLCELFIEAENDYDNLGYSDSLESIDSIIDEHMLSYCRSLANAVNNNDFKIVEPYLLKGSPLYNTQKNLVKNLNEKGIREELLYYDLLNIEKINDDTYEVTTYEAFNIISNNNVEEKDYEWTYTVKIVEGQPYLANIR
ncbi:PEGA domain-containing protein [Anaerosalibacter bizertensis]|uniref:TcaA 3rd/4th domain-containing protein n=1 Tax=Anaerosalibacter bizertensis TaxID=932217 RepID=UPI001C0F0059|nr:PEGA domain-containing protein [Anaerosalibacter bizertensis]MBU5292916.1 PEGA domain-containing protein [Anaerosalibacter bizertensis]